MTIELTTPACPVKDEMQAEARRRIEALSGVTELISIIGAWRSSAQEASRREGTM